MFDEYSLSLNLEPYQPNWFMEYVWFFFAIDNWLQNTIFIIILLILSLIHFKWIFPLNNSKNKSELTSFISTMFWLFTISIIGFQFYIKNIIPYTNVQQLLWFQTSYPNYHRNDVLSACALEYKTKLNAYLKNQNADKIHRFYKEMDACIDLMERKDKVEQYNQALLQETQQNADLLRDYTGHKPVERNLRIKKEPHVQQTQ